MVDQETICISNMGIQSDLRQQLHVDHVTNITAGDAVRINGSFANLNTIQSKDAAICHVDVQTFELTVETEHTTSVQINLTCYNRWHVKTYQQSIVKIRDIQTGTQYDYDKTGTTVTRSH